MAANQHNPSVSRGTWCIYILRDPSDGSVRYVGSTNNSSHRLRQHLRDGRKLKSAKGIWLRELIAGNLKPVMELIESGHGRGRVAAERRWIKYYKNAGCKLTNGTPGHGWEDGVASGGAVTFADLVASFAKLADSFRKPAKPSASTGQDVYDGMMRWFEAHDSGLSTVEAPPRLSANDLAAAACRVLSRKRKGA